MLQQSFVIVKPDAVAAGHIGAILARYEAAGLKVVELQLRTIDGEFADKHYAEHLARDFYPPLRVFMTSGPLVAAILAGPNAIAAIREINGATDPAKAAAGTLRADYGTSVRENAVHGSDSPESAAAEIGLWFPALVASSR